MGACRACGFLSRIPINPAMPREHQMVTPAMRQDFSLVSQPIRIQGLESDGRLACFLGRPECAPDGGCKYAMELVPGLTPAEHYFVKAGVRGPEGPTGARGERGFAGLPGRDGKDGRPGRDGRDLRWDAASIGIVLAGEVGLLWLAKLLGWL